MRYLVTGSSGHLGEALVRTLKASSEDVVSLDIKPGAFTSHVGSIVDRAFLKTCMEGVQVVFHTATLHKPHVATHARQEFVDTNISGTLTLLEEARNSEVSSFIFTSTTSTFGHALSPSANGPAVWITEDIVPQPKNIYGITKLAAENLCWLAHRKDELNCLILRTSRFFPEDDDSKAMRQTYDSDNAKVNELLYRRVDIEDVVSAHLAAASAAPEIGFGRYIISATSPFNTDDLETLRKNAPDVVSRYADFEETYDRMGWSMFPSIDRVYVNERACKELGWTPKHDFQSALDRINSEKSPFSNMTSLVGIKNYHDKEFKDGPYPVD